MEWTHNASERGTAAAMRDPRSGRSQETHTFCLRLHQKHKHIVTQYLQHIRKVANERLEQRSELQVKCCPYALSCFTIGLVDELNTLIDVVQSEAVSVGFLHLHSG